MTEKTRKWLDDMKAFLNEAKRLKKVGPVDLCGLDFDGVHIHENIGSLARELGIPRLNVNQWESYDRGQGDISFVFEGVKFFQLEYDLPKIKTVAAEKYIEEAEDEGDCD
jgi:hypothetical protein